MSSEPYLILMAYCVAIIAASLLGGWLPAMVRMTHTRTQLVMSLVAGLMLGVALYHLLPHGLAQLAHSSAAVGGDSTWIAAIDMAVWWVMAGMILMLLLLRLFHFHQHDFSSGEQHHHEQYESHPLDTLVVDAELEHKHEHDHTHDEHGPSAHPLSWVGIALGLGLHTLIDGVALGASIKIGWAHHDAAGLVGLGVFLAILLHKPLDAMSITSLMQAGGWSRRARSIANITFAMMCPLGALAFFWGAGMAGINEGYVVGSALSFSAGVFLCIALGDLLPEVHFHSHDRFKLTLFFLIGIGVAYALRFVEPGLAHGLEVFP